MVFVYECVQQYATPDCLDDAMFQVCFFVPEPTSVLMVECRVDSMVGNRVPILVTRDALLAGDVMKLLTSAAPNDFDITCNATPSSMLSN